MATTEEIQEAAESGLIGGLQHESVQENDRVLRYQDPEKILNLSGKIDRSEASTSRRYGGPRRLRVDFSDADR